jgi:hypothetical protein
LAAGFDDFESEPEPASDFVDDEPDPDFPESDFPESELFESPFESELLDSELPDPEPFSLDFAWPLSESWDPERFEAPLRLSVL